MKNTLNYKRGLILVARTHLNLAVCYRWLHDWDKWNHHMHYATQARRMAGVL